MSPEHDKQIHPRSQNGAFFVIFVKGTVIELDEPIPYTDGTRVEINIKIDNGLRKGSPKAILQLSGTLTFEESESILKAI